MKKLCFGLRLCRGLRFTTRRDYKIPPSKILKGPILRLGIGRIVALCAVFVFDVLHIPSLYGKVFC